MHIISSISNHVAKPINHIKNSEQSKVRTDRSSKLDLQRCPKNESTLKSFSRRPSILSPPEVHERKASRWIRDKTIQSAEPREHRQQIRLRNVVPHVSNPQTEGMHFGVLRFPPDHWCHWRRRIETTFNRNQIEIGEILKEEETDKGQGFEE